MIHLVSHLVSHLVWACPLFTQTPSASRQRKIWLVIGKPLSGSTWCPRWTSPSCPSRGQPRTPNDHVRCRRTSTPCRCVHRHGVADGRRLLSRMHGLRLHCLDAESSIDLRQCLRCTHTRQFVFRYLGARIVWHRCGTQMWNTDVEHRYVPSIGVPLLRGPDCLAQNLQNTLGRWHFYNCSSHAVPISRISHVKTPTIQQRDVRWSTNLSLHARSRRGNCRC